jgi:hypothetical protein
MKGLELKSHGKNVAALAGVGALLVTVGCSTARDANGVLAQQLTANQAGTPVVVSCQPDQRALVRQTIVNGAAVSQVECVAAAAQQAAYAQAPIVQPVAASPVAYSYPAPRAAQPVYSDLGDAQVVPVARAPRTVAQPVRTSQVVYDEQPVKRGRSVKKSAIIIGSSAGVGAGVGAAVGGKKGALIGAAIGGGGATVWDQITRRK